MNLVRHAKQLAAVVAAFSGLSLSTAYSAPDYTAGPLSPLDTTSLNSSAPLLNNFNDYLQAIQDELPASKTLALPDGPVPGGLEAPLDPEYYAAVAQAVAADPAHAEQIVSAAIQYKPGKVKDIVKNVVLTTPTSAPEAVAAAARAVPAKAGDAAAGAILALVTHPTFAETPADLAAAADEALMEQTRELVEKVAKAAVAATKLSSTQSASAVLVAETLVQSYLADAASANSNAELFLDDIARGAIAGVHGFANTTKSQVATAILNKVTAAPSATQDQVVNFAMGALKASLILANAADPNSYDSVTTALVTAAGGPLSGPGAAIQVGAQIQRDIRNLPSGSDVIAEFNTKLTATQAAHIGAYVSGAVQAAKSKAGDLVLAAYTDAQAGTLSLAQKQAVLSAAITGNFGATAKAVKNAVTAAGANKLTGIEAVQAAIPAATELYSGIATLNAIKAQIPSMLVPSAATDSQAILQAALTTANSVNYQNTFGDIALNAAKAAKIHDNAIVATAVNTVPAGWEEAVAAYIIANNPKDKPDTVTTKTNLDVAIDTATSKGADVASVTLAVNIAKQGKISPKTLFDDAIEKAYQNADKPRAILFGAGAANAKLQAPLLGMLMRLQSGGNTRAELKNFALSLNKKNKVNLELAYEAAIDAIEYPDNIFDLIDHKVLTNPKGAVDIVSAVVSARPEYAHYAARAAAFRSPGSVGKTAAAAITFAHMRSNRTAAGATVTNPDDPAAVAAISAAVVLGVKDAKLATPAKEEAAIKAAISGLVKASLAFQNPGLDPKLDPNYKAGLVGNDATFKEASGAGTDINVSGNYVLRRTKGTAAVLTGAIAQLQVDDLTTAGNELETLSPLAKIAITAAAKAVKLHSLAFAQAAGAAAAAAAVAGGTVFTDFAGIASAFSLVVGAPSATQLEAAARFGANQFAAGEFGAGAAGILNYGHVSGNNTPVTDISPF